MKKLFAKIFLFYLVLIIVTILTLLISFFSSIKKHDSKLTKTFLVSSAKTIRAQISDNLEIKNYSKIDDFVEIYAHNSEYRVTIIDSSGKVIADSERDPKKMNNHYFRSEIIMARNENMGSSLRFSNTLEKNMIYVAIIHKKQGNIQGYIRVSYFESELKNLWKEMQGKIILSSLIILFILLIVSFFFSKKITNPIKKIIEAAQNVASGNLNINLFTKKNDEIGQLVKNFDTMICELRESIQALKSQKNETRSIVEAINAIIWVMNSEDKIVTYNSAFVNFTQDANCKRKNYRDVIQDKNLLEIITDYKRKDSNKKAIDVQIDGRIYYLNYSKIKNNQNVLFVLTDITELKKIQTIKKDFVANASHELKTPLTSIKGFVETLDDEITDESQKHYLKIIKRNIDRLVNITRDIITLNALESGQSLELKKSNLVEIIENVELSLSKKIHEKKIDFEINYNENLEIEIDSYRIEQVFFNLLMNAVKYSHTDKIEVNLTFDKLNCYIAITDFGIGIPKNKIPRLFERFFVIDSSHSRRVDGTGLGLAIVKHIISSHNGNISVHSELNSGTTFKIVLPRKFNED